MGKWGNGEMGKWENRRIYLMIYVYGFLFADGEAGSVMLIR